MAFSHLHVYNDDNDDAVVSDVAAADDDDDEGNFIKNWKFFISEMFSSHKEKKKKPTQRDHFIKRREKNGLA